MNTGSVTGTNSSGLLGVDITGPNSTEVANILTTNAIVNFTAFSDANLTGYGNTSVWHNGTSLKNVTVSEVFSRKVESLEHLAVIYMCILGVLVIIANCTVLAISKFATGGKSATLIFVRSLCVSDSIAGLYAVIKTVFIYVDVERALVNCFVGECLFFTSLMASVFTLLLLTADCFFRLLYPLQCQSYMDKKLVIIYMIFLWNFSFIIGFCPLNGWNNNDYDSNEWTLGKRCMFFHYYPSAYFVMVTSIFVTCIVFMFGLHVKISITARSKAWWAKRFGRQRTDLKKTMKVVTLVRIDMIASCVFYLPFFVYTLLYCKDCLWHDINADALYLFFIPFMLVKSLLNAMIHGGRTSQFKQVLHRFVRSRSLAEAFGGSDHHARATQQESIPSVDATLDNRTKRMKPDLSSATLVTMVSTESDHNFSDKKPATLQASNSTVLSNISIVSGLNSPPHHCPVQKTISDSTVQSVISADSYMRQKELQQVTNVQNILRPPRYPSSSVRLPNHTPLRRTKSADYSYMNGKALRHSSPRDSCHLAQSVKRHSRHCPVHGHENSGYIPELLPIHFEKKQSESVFTSEVTAKAVGSSPVVVSVEDAITPL
ncbi:adenosine receptor A2a-like [Lineus longissimus]|uniref:adenosine receptor A2a-like n=1 Tax=Lineus longissimus TaxID=88925 RepID=UPI00315CEA6E